MAVKSIEIKSFDDLMTQVKERSYIFLIKQELELLEAFIRGVTLPCQLGYSEFPEKNPLEGFNEFVKDKVNSEFQNSFGWLGYLVNEYGNNKEGFDKFFEFYDEFKRMKKKC